MTPEFYNNLKKWRSKKIIGIIVFDFVLAILIGVAIGFYWYMLQDIPRKPILHIFIFIGTILTFSLIVLFNYHLDIPTMENYYLGLNTKEAVLKNNKDYYDQVIGNIV